MIKILILFFFVFNNYYSLFAQGDNLIPPNMSGGYWNNKKYVDENITVSVSPFIINSEAALQFLISQSKIKTDIDYEFMGLPSYKHYYDFDLVKIVCSKNNGKVITFSHTFENWIDTQIITFGRNHHFTMNSESGCVSEPGDKYDVYINGVLKFTYKMPSETYMDNFWIAAQRNTEISEMERQNNLQSLYRITMSNGISTSNNINGNNSSTTGTSTSSKPCTFCNGTGISPLKKSVANYSGTNSYCNICGSYSSPHYHESCPSCMGKGYN